METSTVRSDIENTDMSTYIVKGMDCPSCALTVEKGVGNLEGVESVTINYSTQKMNVAGGIDRETLRERVRALGYDLEEKDVKPTDQDQAAVYLSGQCFTEKG